jgi:hypothetical protein
MIAQFDFRGGRFEALRIGPVDLSSCSQTGASLHSRELNGPPTLSLEAPPGGRQVFREGCRTLILTPA